MEALGAAASIVQLIDIALRSASALVEYTRNTQNATADRKLLAEEAGNLTLVLKRLKQHAEDESVDQEWLEGCKDLFRQFARALDDLAETLHLDISTGTFRHESRLQAFKTLAKWSFTKSEVYSLLERVTRLQQYANALLLHEQHGLVRKLDQRQQEAAEHAQRQEILDWLTPLRMRDVHQTIASRAGRGSGKWCLMSDEFVTWRSQSNARLWCPGIPGAGKTVMASIMYEHLRATFAEGIRDGDVGIAIVYLKYNDPMQTLEHLIGAILRQLNFDIHPMKQMLVDLHKEHAKLQTSPDVMKLSSALAQTSKSMKESFIIIDALDECHEDVRWGILDTLRVILDATPQMHLLITSRPLDSIDEELADFSRLPIKASRADMELFIDQHIEKNRNLKRICSKCPGLDSDLKDSVINTAKDMFLLARLHVESLAGAAALSISHVRKKLRSLPDTLQGTYEDAMRRIEAQEDDRRAIALKTLAWLSYAFRVLTVGELQHALAIEPGEAHLDTEMLMDAPSITALCAGLVVVDLATNTVTFVHYTASKFFIDLRTDRFPGFHATITMSCATYLALKELSAASVWTIVRHHPLACYAAQFMGDHARQTPEEALEQSVLQKICRLLAHPSKRKALLSLIDSLDLIQSGFYATETKLACADPDRKIEADKESVSGESTSSTAITLTERMQCGLSFEDMADDMIENTKDLSNLDDGWTPEDKLKTLPEVTALHLAASMGLAKVASMLLSDVPDIDAVDATGKTALAVAIERGFEKAVELLVNSGATVQLESQHGVEVFLLVAESDWHGVATIIAKNAGYSVSEPDHDRLCPAVKMVLAAYFGDLPELQSLVRKDSAKFDKDLWREAGTALFLSVERGHTNIVTFLIDHGVNIDAKDSAGQTALHRATRRGSTELIRVLLKHGASVDCKNDASRTPWSANLRTNNHTSLDLLLKAGADPNTKGLQGVSELYEAATNGETSVVRYMLESGTDPSIKTQFLWTPLHWAAYGGHTECVTLLLNSNAELSPVSDQDATPLDLALRANQIQIVDILIRAGCVESRDVEPSAQQTTCGDDLSRGWDPTVDEKLSLAFDKPIQQGMNVGQYVYPSSTRNSTDYIYQISDPLDSLNTGIGVRRSSSRADMVDYPLAPDHFDFNDALFDICRLSIDYQVLEIRPRQQAGWIGVIQMKRDWTGSWKIFKENEQQSEYLFRTSPDWAKSTEQGCRWSTETGTLLARNGVEGVTPWLTFEPGLDRQVQDSLVACWIAKLWSENVALPGRSRGQSVDTEQSWIKV